MLNLRWFMLFLLLNVLLCSYGDFLSSCQKPCSASNMPDPLRRLCMFAES